MSIYDDKEESLSSSSPYELYQFDGTFKSYYLTSDLVVRNFNSVDFIPSPGLSRSNLNVGTHETDDIAITVNVNISEQVVKDYAFQTTPPSLQLTIYRFQRENGSYVTYWKGIVSAISVSGEECTFKTPSKFNSLLSGNIPCVYVQPPCNNVLFDELCKVDKVSNSYNTTVASFTENIIEIASLGGFPDGWFLGGEIVVTSFNERRKIVQQTGTILKVNYNFVRMSVGTPVNITAGCDHSYTGANGCPKFANQKNFGGCPFVPGESNNVFSSGVE